MSELMTPLETLTAEANEIHGEIAGALRTTVDLAIACGERLSAIRDMVPDFKAWCAQEFAGGRTSAYKFIKLYERRDLACSLSEHGVNEAYALVTKAEKDAKREEANDENEERGETLDEIDRSMGEPTPAPTELDAKRKVAQIAQRLETAQALVGAAVAELTKLVDSHEGSERAWLESLRGWVVSANDDLVEFVECGMTGGAL